MDPILVAILLYFAAIILAFTDLFVPSSGMLIILAVLAAIGSALFAFRSSSTAGLVMLVVLFASVPTIAMVAFKIWPHTPIGKRIILRTPGTKQKKEEEVDPLIGTVVLTASSLMPSGQIQVDHRRLNAIAKSGIIEKGQSVEVLEFRERNYIVRASNKPLTDFSALATKSPTADSLAAEEQTTNATPEEALLDIPVEDLGLDSLDE